jgi:flavin reductase (DIM6/NTAB) family NADH-FMN oxidoreductase RutF
MNNNFKKIDPSEIPDNVFRAIGDDWMLITAGTPESYNTMTASWGTLGILWNLPVAICFIRPQRYTYIFAERSSHYTLSFFEENYRDALRFCGSKSGRDYDKAAETGLKPITTDLGNVSFDQARLILECKKLYNDDLKPEHFIAKELINKNYPKKDFHRFYLGEVVNVLIK